MVVKLHTGEGYAYMDGGLVEGGENYSTIIGIPLFTIIHIHVSEASFIQEYTKREPYIRMRVRVYQLHYQLDFLC